MVFAERPRYLQMVERLKMKTEKRARSFQLVLADVQNVNSHHLRYQLFSLSTAARSLHCSNSLAAKRLPSGFHLMMLL